MISFSTQPGNVALDGTGRNSPYAAALIKHIATPGDDLPTILINLKVVKRVGKRKRRRKMAKASVKTADNVVPLNRRRA